MADKQISQLVAATTINNDDLFVMQQGGTAKKLSGQKLSDFVYQSAADQIERVNEAVEQTQAAVDSLEEQKNEIAQTIASMAELGTDTTLTTPGMAADAAATGVVKDTALARFEQAEITGVPIATFDDGADDVPVKKLVVNIEPVQNLHGQANPYPAGGSNNIFDGVWESGTINIETGSEESSDSYKRSTNNIQVSHSEYNCVASGAVGIRCYANDDTYLGNVSRTSGGPGSIIALIENTAYVRLVCSNSVASGNVGLNYPSSVTDYVPYSNICPITGWTGATIERSGNTINAWDEQWEVGTINTNTGAKEAANDRIRSKNFIPVKPNSTYYAVDPTNSNNIRVFRYNADKTFRSATAWIGNTAFTVPDGCYYILFIMGSAYGATYNNNISINYPSTETAYHAFVGDVYNVSFPNEAGTVYSGTLDVMNGVLTVDKLLNTVTALTSVVKNSEKALTDRYSITLATSVGNFKNDSTNISNIARYNWGVMGHTDTTAPYQFVVYNNLVYFTYPAGTETSDVKAWLIDNNAQFLTALSVPLTYTLTSTEVKTLLALNNIWADTGNINDLIYRKMPIPVEELENTLESMIAGVEETMEATQNYTVDKLVVVAHKLYHIDSNIASGETLVPGTNCHVTTVADELANFMSTVDGYFAALGSLATLNYQVVT